jgi:hypothetical protein
MTQLGLNFDGGNDKPIRGGMFIIKPIGRKGQRGVMEGIAAVDAERRPDGSWKVTVVTSDAPGWDKGRTDVVTRGELYLTDKEINWMRARYRYLYGRGPWPGDRPDATER